ncbi:TetR/AcrR family transcriptional regulator [Chryseobacterium sp. CCH4-E10]|uniref:TetR/AcrR family transcriptional regulator n=1 Tax=Chryseobacterium sp. CCH4-E10 TaxID=1768758 RepID=UPI00083101A6|nr:TetR/AcrR family transcriptional regulator [Chryseobacterium sp. CCH4-E10]
MEHNAYSRKKEPELNKQLIIEAATDIGSETDWHQVTFQAIADRTGLSKGGIIHHFRNKEELLDELLNQSLREMTLWVENYKTENGENDGALAYLESILGKQNDEKYIKTMRIVLQAIMINSKYRKQWQEWYDLHILPSGEELSIRSLVVFLIADGLWYNENMSSRHYTAKEKKKILEYVKQMK